jgi:hypothetical protein
MPERYDPEEESRHWIFSRYASRLLLLGVLLIVLSLILRHQTAGEAGQPKATGEVVALLLDLLLEAGKALLITGAIAWVLEVAHVVSYVEDRLFRVFLSTRFLAKLSLDTLGEVHRAVTKFLVGGPDDADGESFYSYLRNHHIKLAGETYRRNLDVTVEIEPHGDAPTVKQTTIVQYTVVPIRTRGTTKYRVPSPLVVDAIPGVKAEDHVSEWLSRVLYQSGKTIENTTRQIASIRDEHVDRVQVS